MIYEIRTYQVRPGSLPEVSKRFGEAYEHRKKYSQLAAFLHTEIGPQNEFIHIWKYKDLAERARIRAEAVKDPNWPPKIHEFLLDVTAEVMNPFPFSPEALPPKMGPVFEFCYDNIDPRALPGGQVRKCWEPAIAERVKLSPLVMAGMVEFGDANGFVHVWGYESLQHRTEVTTKAREMGVWPPPGAIELPVKQRTKIMSAASWSPLQ